MDNATPLMVVAPAILVGLDLVAVSVTPIIMDPLVSVCDCCGFFLVSFFSPFLPCPLYFCCALPPLSFFYLMICSVCRSQVHQTLSVFEGAHARSKCEEIGMVQFSSRPIWLVLLRLRHFCEKQPNLHTPILCASCTHISTFKKTRQWNLVLQVLALFGDKGVKFGGWGRLPDALQYFPCNFLLKKKILAFFSF